MIPFDLKLSIAQNSSVHQVLQKFLPFRICEANFDSIFSKSFNLIYFAIPTGYIKKPLHCIGETKNERINIFALKINDTLMNISNMKWLKDGSMVVGREGYYLLAKSLTSPALLRINCPRWIMIQLQIRMIQLQIWMIQLQIRMIQLQIWLIHLQERMALKLDLFYFWQREAPWNQIYSCLQLLKTDNHIAETFSSFPLLLPFFNCPSNFLAMPWCILQDWIWYLTGSYFSKKHATHFLSSILFLFWWKRCSKYNILCSTLKMFQVSIPLFVYLPQQSIDIKSQV